MVRRLAEVDRGAADATEHLREQREAAAREKQQRVEHLCGMIGRRMLWRDLARGWTAWHEAWEEEQRRRRVLQQAVGRLRNPVVSDAFCCWRGVAEAQARRERVRVHGIPTREPSQSLSPTHHEG